MTSQRVDTSLTLHQIMYLKKKEFRCPHDGIDITQFLYKASIRSNDLRGWKGRMNLSADFWQYGMQGKTHHSGATCSFAISLENHETRCTCLASNVYVSNERYGWPLEADANLLVFK